MVLRLRTVVRFFKKRPPGGDAGYFVLKMFKQLNKTLFIYYIKYLLQRYGLVKGCHLVTMAMPDLESYVSDLVLYLWSYKTKTV